MVPPRPVSTQLYLGSWGSFQVWFPWSCLGEGHPRLGSDMASPPGPLLESTWSTPWLSLGGAILMCSSYTIGPSLCRQEPHQGTNTMPIQEHVSRPCFLTRL